MFNIPFLSIRRLILAMCVLHTSYKQTVGMTPTNQNPNIIRKMFCETEVPTLKAIVSSVTPQMVPSTNVACYNNCSNLTYLLPS